MDAHTMSNRDAVNRIRQVAEGNEPTSEGPDRPVLMLNLNQYTADAQFPRGREYLDYMLALEHAVGAGGGKVLWRAPNMGQVIGCGHDDYDEVLAVWYPSHQAFLDLRFADGADAMFAGRERCVANATILALPAEADALRPASGPE